MGYDVSFHPISPDEIQEWYFTPLTWIQQGQEEKVLALAAQHGIEDFYAEKYLDTLRVGAETESDELFDKSHGFYIAVVQGFFRDYYYTRGSSFSFLMEEKPEYARYFTPWAQVVPTALPNPAKNQIMENYCSGVYLSPNQVLQILRDLEQEPKVLEDLEKRHIHYNETLEKLGSLEKAGRVHIIRPSQPVKAAMIERDADNLERIYQMGRSDMEKDLEQLRAYLH